MSAKLSPIQLNSLCPEVFSKGRMSTTSLPACAVAAGRACAGEAAKSASAMASAVANRLSMESILMRRQKPRGRRRP